MNVGNLAQRTETFELIGSVEGLYKEAIDIYSHLSPLPLRELANAEMGLGIYYGYCKDFGRAHDLLVQAKVRYLSLLKSARTIAPLLIDVAKVNCSLASVCIELGQERNAYKKLAVSHYILAKHCRHEKQLLKVVFEHWTRLAQDMGEEPPSDSSSYVMSSCETWFNNMPDLNAVLQADSYEAPPTNKAITDLSIALLTGAGASMELDFSGMTKFVGIVKQELPMVAQYLSLNDDDDLESVIKKLMSLWFQETQKTGSIRANDLRDIIAKLKNLICSEYSREPKMPSLTELYDPLISCLMRFTSQLPVFTFNYDMAIERFARSKDMRLVHGFPALRWSQDEFTKYAHHKNENDILLFKLHGSAGWRYNYMTEELSDFQQDMPSDMTGYANAVIYPIQPKISLFNPVLEFLNSYFDEMLKKLRVLIVVGYSFRDAHARTKLKRAKQINPNLVVISVDTNTESLQQLLEPLGFTCGQDFFPMKVAFKPGVPWDELLAPLIQKSLH
jgi:hypothetical protein